MKKLTFGATVLCLLAGPSTSRATISQLNIELMFGAEWYAGKKACVSGNGICISSSSIADNVLYYDDVSNDLWIEVSVKSPVYKQLKDSVWVGKDSEIDSNTADKLGLGASCFIKKGNYAVTQDQKIRTIHLDYYQK